MVYGSVCSGIEAATVAWHPLGWRAAFFAEIEPFPCAVLNTYYPTVPNHGDMTKFKEWPDATLDVLVGGTPCQSFSVAGLRKGLDDPRGNLTLTYLAVAEKYRPRWLVWENVPGVLSDGTGAFGAFLGGLGQLGYGFAYRVLDAQYFGVPQRRRRVFVVGCLGDWRRAAAVLFERESMSGNPPPRREAGQAASGGAAGRAGERSHWDGDFVVGVDTLNHSTSSIAQTIKSPGGGVTESVGAVLVPFDPLQITSKQKDNVVPMAFAIGSHAGAADGDQTNRSHASGGPVGSNISEEVAYSLRGGRSQSVGTAMQVRRLTPRECERLQGFPDDYTLIQYRGKPAADGPRYKALGNSMAVPVMRWIGERIQAVETIKEAA